MGKQKLSKDYQDDPDDLYNENIQLSQQLKQKNELIDRLSLEIKQLKARLNELKVIEKDKLIEKLNLENSKLKETLSLARVFSP